MIIDRGVLFRMRLSEREIKIIREAFHRHFSKEDHLWLFGSRADPNRRGGDMDFYIETHEKDANRVVGSKMAFVNDLWTQLGEQKIDVVLHLLSSSHHEPIYDVARTEGIFLI